jgi:CheY-like chemotaxis protein
VNQKVILQQLENLGYQADTVGNGLEALQAMEHVDYDVILMDCQMPEMDGYTATETLRQRENGTSHVPVIAMTAHVMTGDREKCLAAGMDDYVAKPIKTEHLQAALARWCRPNAAVPPSKTAAAPSPLDDPKFVRSISNLFLKETPKYLKAMSFALQRKDAAQIRMAAHTLIGSCCIFGTQGIKTLCRQIEDKALADDFEALGPLLRRLNEEFDDVRKSWNTPARREHHENTHRR